jgi:UDP-2-acetamido-3-amino-2,3-dideoxy-glucuronate N-acetyltransferase
MDYFQHETAIIDEGAKIGTGSRVWHFVHVSAEAVIGDNVSLGQGVYIGNRVTVGHRCKIQNNVSVYDNVYLADDVFCGPSVVFTNVYNPRSQVERKDEYRDTHIAQGASLGANCTIVCGVTVGSYAFVGAGSVVTTDVKPFALVVGVPARQISWMSKFGERLDLPLEGEGKCQCPNTGDVYKLIDSNVMCAS